MENIVTFKKNLYADYLNIYKYDKTNEKDRENYKTISQAIKFPYSEKDVVAYKMNQAALGKNKHSYRGYALFTENEFFGVDIYETPVNCKFSNIHEVCLTKSTKKSMFSMLVSELFDNGVGIVKCCDDKSLSLSPEMAETLKAFTVINRLTKTDETPYREFLISQVTSMFGELGWNNDSEDKQIDKICHSDATKFIRFYCKLRKLTTDCAYYEITIPDKRMKSSDYPDALYTKEEWERAVTYFINSCEIRQIYANSILRQHGLKYNIEEIIFETNIRTTLTTHLKNASATANNVMDKVTDMYEDRVKQAERDYERTKNKGR